MTPPRPLRLALLAALPIGCALSSVLALVALNGGGAMRLGSIELLPIAAGYDRRATQLTLGAPPPAGPLRAEAFAKSRAAIAQFPYDTSAWLRLAYLGQDAAGRLTPEGLAALSRSYDLVAVDPDFALWRIGYALEHSQDLPKPLRALVRQEAAALWTQPGMRGRLRDLQAQLRNPAGRLSLALWINLLQAKSANETR